jgi:hypothetical protein
LVADFVADFFAAFFATVFLLADLRVVAMRLSVGNLLWGSVQAFDTTKNIQAE